MDTRGYGRSAGATPGERRATGALMIAGLRGICVGVYAGLDTTAPRLPGRRRCWCSASSSRSSGWSARAAACRAPLPPRPLALARAGRDGGRARRRRSRVVGRRPPDAGRLPGPSTSWPQLTAGARCSPSRRSALAGRRRRPREPQDGGRMIELRGVTLRLRRRARSSTSVDLDHRGGRAGARLRPDRRRASRRCSGVVTGLVPRFTGGTSPATLLLDGASILATPPRERAHVDRLRRPGPARRVRHRHGRGGARLRHGAARPAGRHDAAPGGGDARPAGHRRPPRARPAHPLGRPAAAGRHRLGAHHAPSAAGARRADLGARPDRGRGRARDADPAGPRPRRLGPARRAPPRAGGPVRRPDGLLHRATAGSRSASPPTCWPTRPSCRRSSSSAGTPAGRRCR